MDEHLLRLVMRLAMVHEELGHEAYGAAVRSAEAGIARAILHIAEARAAAHSVKTVTTADVIRLPLAGRSRDDGRLG